MSSIIDIVNALRKAGLCMLPSGGGPDGKAPDLNTWKQFQKKRPSDNIYNSWFYKKKPSSYGALTGKISKVVVVDCDSEEAVAEMGDLKPHVKTPRGGYHYYFEYPGYRVKSPVGILPHVDIRADGGFANIVGTNPKTGGEYHILIMPTPDTIYPWSKLPKRIREKMEGDPATYEGAIRALDGVPEGHRDKDIYAYACRLFGAGLEEREVIPLVQLAASKCTPPFPEKEALAKVESAAKYMFESDIHPTDQGNADMLAKMFGDGLRYDHEKKIWLRYGTHHWEPDSDGYVSRLVVKVAKARQKRARNLKGNDEDKKREFRWGIASEHRRQIDNCMVRARDTKPIADDGRNWDQNKMLLGAPNGVVNLETGELRDGRPEDRITMSIGTEFDPDATCSLFEQFLDRVTGNEATLKGYLQRIIGYTLTGAPTMLAFFFLYGPSHTGKSTLVSTLAKLMGEYSWKAPSDLLLLKDRLSGGHKESLANLEGKRFVYASETEENRKLANSLVKDMTGGEVLTADKKYSHERQFRPQFKLWLSGNHKPTISDTSQAMWNRLKLIPFEAVIPDDEIDYDLQEKLEKELAGILNWAIKGCIEWKHNGLGEPEIVTESVKEYQMEQDTFGRFIEDECIQVPDGMTRASRAYHEYTTWSKREGIGRFEMLSPKAFGRKMAERYRREKTRGGLIYSGVRLKRSPTHVFLDMTEDE